MALKHSFLKKFLSLYNNSHLIYKIIVAFIFAAVIPILIIQFVSFVLNSRNLSNKIDEIMRTHLVTISEQVQIKMEVYKSVLHNIQMDNTVIEHLFRLSDNEQQRATSYNAIVKVLKQYHSTTQGIRSICVVLPNGDTIIYDADTDSSLDNIWRDTPDLREIGAYRNALQSSQMIITPTTRFADRGSEVYLFHLSRAIYDLNDISTGPVAVVILSVHETVLNALCNTPDSEMNTDHSINFIMDDSRNVISYPSSFYTGIALDDKYDAKEFAVLTGFLQNKQLGVNTYFDPSLEWHYYNVYDRDYVLRDLNRQQIFFLIIGFVLLSISVLLIQFMVRNIGRSLNELMNGIQQVQAGNLDVEVCVYSQDEFGEIAGNFNTMTGRVKQLIHHVQTAAENQRVAEIRALEAQINPHFMYNTLDSINWMAIDKEEYEISCALRDFGVILRYSISKSNASVPLWEVGDWIKKYVSLNQLRFCGVFDFILNIDDSIKDEPIRKLLVQPFVENAILHGFRGLDSGGILRVDMMPSEDGRSIVILIEDNGKGISPELARQLNEMKADVNNSGHIGIANVFNRLRMYYGEAAQWNISSFDGLGTVVTLIIPKQGDA